MSANKGFETKIHDDENADSGFLSGPIDQLPSELEDEEVESESREVCDTEDMNPDSGVGLCVDGFNRLGFEESPTARPVELKVQDTQPEEIPDKDLPPLAVLFQQDDDGDT